MGRGAYNLADAKKEMSMADHVLRWEGENRQKRESAAAEAAAEAAVAELEQKLARCKKGRAFQEVKRAAMMKQMSDKR